MGKRENIYRSSGNSNFMPLRHYIEFLYLNNTYTLLFIQSSPITDHLPCATFKLGSLQIVLNISLQFSVSLHTENHA